MNIRKIVRTSLVVAVVQTSLAGFNRSYAAGIIWSPPVTIAGDADVATNGSLKFAYALSGTTATVTNSGVRVTFTGKTSTTALGNDVGLAGVSGGNYTGFGASVGTFTNLSSACQTVLKGGDYGGPGPITLTLSNLTVGHAYLAQVWVNDSRSNYTSRAETVTSWGGNRVTLDYDNSADPNTVGGVGQFATGTFVADATTQVFKLTGNASSQFNALQLRDLGVESRAGGVWTNTTAGQLWGGAGNWTNNGVATGSGNTADFSQVDLTGYVTVNLETPRVIGNLIFGDTASGSAGGWLLANNGNAGNILTLAGTTPIVTVNSLGPGKDATISAVIGGVNGLTKAGPGRLTLASPNLYTGTTAITAGTLALGTRVAIINSTNIVLASGSALDVSGISFTLSSGQTLSGFGTINGSLALAPGTRIYPGSSGNPGTLTFNNDLELSWGSACYLDLSISPVSGNDQIVAGGHLTLGGTLHLSARGGAASLGTYTDYILFAVAGDTDGTLPALVWDGTRPGNSASFSLAMSGNNLVLHYNAPTLPAAPTNVVAVLATNGVALTWKSSPAAASYNVRRSVVSGGPYELLAAGLTATNYLDTNALANTTCYYVVSSVMGAGEGTNSLPVYALPANFLKANGCDMCDHAGAGRVVPLRGANLGGWLFFEGWMCPNSFDGNGNPLEQDVAANFVSRFGVVTNDLLLDVWRSNWITTNDLDALVALGMNLARFHFTYDSFQELPADSSVNLSNVWWKPDEVAFQYMDWLMAECAKRQIYVVLDYQYPEGGPDNAGPYQDRFIYIWQRIAAHYAGNPTVLGYDLWNEAGGGAIAALFNLTYQAIRQVDADHPVIMEQCWWGPNGDLSLITQAVTNYHWTNIIGEQHYADGPAMSNIVMSLRAAPQGSPAYPVYLGEYMLNGTNYGLPDIPALAGSGALFTSWTLKSVNQITWSLFNMIDNGPGYNSTYVPDLLNDSAGAIAGKWARWRTPPLPQLTVYSGSRIRMVGPVSVDDAFTVGTNGALSVTPSMLLTNDTDLNPSNQLAVVNVPLGRTAHGTLSTTNTSYFYQADPGFNGVDTFTYQTLDQRLGLLSINPGTVNLSVRVPPSPVGLSAQSGVGTVTLRWTNSLGGSGYNLKRATVRSGPYSVISSGLIKTNYTDTNVLACQDYFYVVSALAVGYESPDSSEAGARPFGALPPQFQTTDIGSVGLAGSASCCGGEFTVAGSGSDIWGTADAFRYVYVPMQGDGWIVARVNSVAGTDAWAKAGVMFRETLSANARNVSLVMSYRSGLSCQWRASTSGSTYNAAQPGIAPYWVKLTRTNNTFAGYFSADGNYWTFIGATNINMASSIYAGLAVTAHNNSALNYSAFDLVSASYITNALPSVAWVTPANNSTFIQPRAITLQALATDTDGAVTNVAFYNGAALLGPGIAGAANSYSLTWSNVPVGRYSLSAVATDNDGATKVSSSTTITVLPLTLTIVSGAVTNGPIVLSFAGQNGQAYVVETSTNLANWSPWLTNSPVNGVLTVTDTNSDSPERFYRVRQ